MGFFKPKLPREIPEEIRTAIAEMEDKASGGSQYLAAAYAFVGNRWRSGRMNTVFYFPLAFRRDLLKIWRRPGYAHCNTQNYLLFVLLAGSRFFRPEDVRFRCVFFNMFIHQYLQVRVDGAWVDADPAGATIRGAPLGSHISFFG
ncbi:MAG TPA: hypothetical protein VHA30_03835 [Patescibacteria group bacterium]|nr:hypothetical protein [Patescibacteria group bacterium]